MQIFIAADHAGFPLKESVKKHLTEIGHTIEDLGAPTLDVADDYPDFIVPCAQKVVATPGSIGIIIGGSGQGEAMAANRVPGVRAAVYYGNVGQTQTDASGRSLDIIRSVREHQDANVLSIGARFITEQEADNAIHLFLETPFLGDERHKRRIAKLG